MRISDWSSDLCSSDLDPARRRRAAQYQGRAVSGSAQRVAVIDTGGANLGSVRYALERLGVHPVVVHDADERSEEHTSELQSLMRISYAVFCLKKKKNTYNKYRSLQLIHNTMISE